MVTVNDSRRTAGVRTPILMALYLAALAAGIAVPDSADVVAWVERHGGFPDFATGQVTEMDYAAATAFVPPCCPDVGDASKPIDLTRCRSGRSAVWWSFSGASP